MSNATIRCAMVPGHGRFAMRHDPASAAIIIMLRSLKMYGMAVCAKGGVPRIVATHIWGRNDQQSFARLEAWNQPIHRIRGRIEKIFGTWKRSYGLRRLRWMGLAKASLQIRLTAIAYNMKRALGILAAAA